VSEVAGAGEGGERGQTVSKPTNEDLNRVMAEALGYRIMTKSEMHDIAEDGWQSCAWIEDGSVMTMDNEEGIGGAIRLRYCTDRNRLPEILALLDRKQGQYLSWMAVLLSWEPCETDRDFGIYVFDAPRQNPSREGSPGSRHPTLD